MLNLDQIKKQLNNISKYPWTRVNDHGMWAIHSQDKDSLLIDCTARDVDFIAQAPTIISELVQEVERLRKELEATVR